MMEENNNKYIAVQYRLYVDGEDGMELVEQTSVGKPFDFISGFGIALDAFEAQLIGLQQGQAFAFSLPKEQAYGEYYKERVIEMNRESFYIDGKFDHAHIYPGAIIPLQNEEGTQFYGREKEVSPEKVTVDLTHPLAGETLHFEGIVLEHRDATKEEIDNLIARLTGGCKGCHGGCGGDCEGRCGTDGCEGEDCQHHGKKQGGCGHCH